MNINKAFRTLMLATTTTASAFVAWACYNVYAYGSYTITEPNAIIIIIETLLFSASLGYWFAVLTKNRLRS